MHTASICLRETCKKEEKELCYGLRTIMSKAAMRVAFGIRSFVSLSLILLAFGAFPTCEEEGCNEIVLKVFLPENRKEIPDRWFYHWTIYRDGRLCERM